MNDDIYEGEERFNVTLQLGTDGVGIVLPDNTSKAIITIVDPEDSRLNSICMEIHDTE